MTASCAETLVAIKTDSRRILLCESA